MDEKQKKYFEEALSILNAKLKKCKKEQKDLEMKIKKIKLLLSVSPH